MVCTKAKAQNFERQKSDIENFNSLNKQNNLFKFKKQKTTKTKVGD